MKGLREKLRLGALSCACLVMACAPGDGRGHGRRGVLVIAIDSLRVDHFGNTGYEHDTTPALDRMLESGVWFEEAYTTAPDLIPAHASLLTGCDPRVVRQPQPEDHGFLSLSRQWRFPPEAPSLAAEFLAAGFSTAAFVDHAWLVDQYGFDRGFEAYDSFSGGPLLDGPDFGAGGIGRDFYQWLNSLDRDADWFAYLTINDLERAVKLPNARWDNFFKPREGLDTVPPVARAVHSFFAIPDTLGATPGLTIGEYEAHYDGALRQLDTKLGRLFAQLEAQGRLEHTTICLVGTYGMGFGESGLYLDHGTLSDIDLHVPWMLLPAESLSAPRGVRSPHLASTLDVMPTLLELYDIELPSGLHGVSQLPALAEGSEPVREYAFSSGGLSAGFAVHDARYSFQSIMPAVRGDAALLSSWYGVPSYRPGRMQAYLRDRQAGMPPGDLSPGLVDAEVSAHLRAVGDDWFEWIDRARDALHAPPWLEPPSAEEFAELRARGLLPDEL